jgi:putative PEP-CTERM system TPR-repeat lipoprotein
LLLAARAQLANKDVEGATQTLRKALELQPDRLDVHREAIATYLAAGKPEDALSDAKTLQKARPKEAVGFVLEGEVLAAQKKFGEAAGAYGEALKRQKAPVLALRMHGLLTQAGKKKEADAVLARWMQENPKDVLVRLYLADSALGRKDYNAAVPAYRQILAEQPNNVVVLNNLAWALWQLKDPGALQLAEKAHGLAPDNPAVADTLGVILVEQGDLKRGMQLLDEAVKGAPNVPDLRLHYARALLKSGDKAAARSELEQIGQLQAETPAKAEAEKLLKQL